MSKKNKDKKKTTSKLQIKLKLRVATMDDVLYLKGYKPGKNGGKIKGLKLGMPYWMIKSDGEIENKNYILNETTNKVEFKDYLYRKQILIPAENENRRKA